MGTSTSRKIRTNSVTDSSGNTVDVPGTSSNKPGASGGSSGALGGPPRKPITGSAPKDWMPPINAKPAMPSLPGTRGIVKPPGSRPIPPDTPESQVTKAPAARPKFLGPPVKESPAAPPPTMARSSASVTPNRPGFLGPPVKVPPPTSGSPKPPGTIGSPKPPGTIGSPPVKPPEPFPPPPPTWTKGSKTSTARPPKYSQAGTVKWRY